MLKGNKGEWSELYAFCYILDSGILQSADKDLNPLEGIFFPVIKVIRKEQDEQLEYCTGDTIKIYRGDDLICECEKQQFEQALSTMLHRIPNGERSFQIPEVSDFFRSISVTKLKADSLHKQDIDIQIHDINTGIEPICGFSIKSYLGANPTLINPGRNTNFVFTIVNCSETIAAEVNSIATNRKIIDRMDRLCSSECTFSFSAMCSNQFMENLQFIDSQMPQLVANALLIAYRDNVKPISTVVGLLKEANPMHFRNVNMYEYKFKKFLCACALGMTPEKHWEGAEDANGGYIVVKRDGTVVCYHVYNRTEFEQYLYDYATFDTPSTTRYEYASVYSENNEYMIKLNLQVRFRE